MPPRQKTAPNSKSARPKSAQTPKSAPASLQPENQPPVQNQLATKISPIFPPARKSAPGPKSARDQNQPDLPSSTKISSRPKSARIPKSAPAPLQPENQLPAKISFQIQVVWTQFTQQGHVVDRTERSARAVLLLGILCTKSRRAPTSNSKSVV